MVCCRGSAAAVENGPAAVHAAVSGAGPCRTSANRSRLRMSCSPMLLQCVVAKMISIFSHLYGSKARAEWQRYASVAGRRSKERRATRRGVYYEETGQAGIATMGWRGVAGERCKKVQARYI